jgi:peptide/nickel transport system substrate-binding protein
MLFMMSCQVQQTQDSRKLQSMPVDALQESDIGQTHIDYGGQLALALSSYPSSFSPYSLGTASNEKIASMLFMPLIRRDPIDDHLRPELLREWQVSPDGMRIDMALRESAYWSDGVPVTSADVVFTFEHIVLNAKSPMSQLENFLYQGRLARIEVQDSKHFSLILPHAMGSALAHLVYLPILPQHVLTANDVSPEHIVTLWNTAAWPYALPTSGPFCVDQVKFGQWIALRPNPYSYHYDRLGHQLPFVDRLIYYTIADSTARSYAFIKKRIDMLQPQGKEYRTLVQKYQGDIQVLTSLPQKNEPSVVHMAVNFDVADATKKELFRSQVFRQILDLAIDRTAIIDQIYGGMAQVEGVFLVPNHPYYRMQQRKSLSQDMATNRAQAMQLWQDLHMSDQDGDGYIDQVDGSPLRLQLAVPVGTLALVEPDMAVILQQNFAQIGLNIDVVHDDVRVLAQKWQEGDFELTLRNFANSPDPGVRVRVVWQPGEFLYYFHGSTRHDSQAYFDWEKQLVQAYEHAASTMDEQVRYEAYQKVQQIYDEQLPVIFMVRGYNVWLAQHDVHNIFVDSQGHYLGHLPWMLSVSKKNN